MTNLNLEDYHRVEFSGIKMIMSLIITVDTNEDIDLPGEEYDPKKEYSSKYEVEDDIQEWIDINVTGIVVIDMRNVYFEVIEDAMAFKLRWI